MSCTAAPCEAHSAGPERGSEFVVRLPVDEADACREGSDLHAPAALMAAARPSARRVLVVDDNPDAAERWWPALRLTGHDVRAAYNGGAALDTARGASSPDVVLLDIGLPGMSGYEVARAIRSDPSLSTVLLVAITGWGQLDDRRKARQAGFDHHRVKPVDAGDIEQLIAAASADDARRAE